MVGPTIGLGKEVFSERSKYTAFRGSHESLRATTQRTVAHGTTVVAESTGGALRDPVLDMLTNPRGIVPLQEASLRPPLFACEESHRFLEGVDHLLRDGDAGGDDVLVADDTQDDVLAEMARAVSAYSCSSDGGGGGGGNTASTTVAEAAAAAAAAAANAAAAAVTVLAVVASAGADGEYEDNTVAGGALLADEDVSASLLLLDDVDAMAESLGFSLS